MEASMSPPPFVRSSCADRLVEPHPAKLLKNGGQCPLREKLRRKRGQSAGNTICCEIAAGQRDLKRLKTAFGINDPVS